MFLDSLLLCFGRIYLTFMYYSGGSRISLRWGRQPSGGLGGVGGCPRTILPNFPKNYMKLKEFGHPRGARVPRGPPLDPQMVQDGLMFTRLYNTIAFLCFGRTCDRYALLLTCAPSGGAPEVGRDAGEMEPLSGSEI